MDLVLGDTCLNKMGRDVLAEEGSWPPGSCVETTLARRMLDQQEVPLELKLRRCVGEPTYVPWVKYGMRGAQGSGARDGNAVRTV
jgi:hypothetical protein